MQAIFIYNNLKVDTFNLRDQPFPGFELLTWEHESYIHGTLWDIGLDAGYTEIGIDNVYGQIWLTDSIDPLQELSYFLGYPNRTYQKKMRAIINDDNNLIKEQIDATVYILKEIRPEYKRINDGKWFLKRG
ncbi:hypothetical protein EBU71_07245 [bacterium]|jgi:gamma-glutamylcyclotransferase (GGCT)/AIG2-like uncharacterized protein YtfP|nr:hypothetical protein [Candidatus Elulimicrobium humile]